MTNIISCCLKFMLAITLISFANAQNNEEFIPNIEQLYKLIESCGAPKDIDNRYQLGLSIYINAEGMRDHSKGGITYSEAHQQIITEMYQSLDRDYADGYYCDLYKDISGDRQEEFSKAIRLHALAVAAFEIPAKDKPHSKP